MKRHLTRLLTLFALSLFAALPAAAGDFSGCWWGVFEAKSGNLRTTLELKQKGNELTGTLSTLGRKLKSYPLENASIGKGLISFSLGGIEAENRYVLHMQEDGSMAGEETMDGRKTPLKYERIPEGADFPEGGIGVFEGNLNLGTASLRLVIQVIEGTCGQAIVMMDSPDQGAFDLPSTWAQWDKDGLFVEWSYLNGKMTMQLSEDGQTLAGEFTQAATYKLSLKKRDTPLVYNRPQDPKPPFPYSEEEVEVKNGDITLTGTLTVPEGEGPHPAVMLLTGSGAQDRNESLMGHKPFWVLADHLSRNGVAVLRVDDRGVGGSNGDIYKATLADNAADALAGVALLKADKRVDKDHIGLIGHSEGGWMAPLAAVQSEDVDFIVLLAGPGVSGEEILYAQSDLMLKHQGMSDGIRKVMRNNQKITFGIIKDEKDDEKAKAAIIEAVEAYEASLPEDLRKEIEEIEKTLPEGTEEKNLALVVTPWFRDLVSYDPRETLKKLTCPVLAVIGELDFQVPPEQNIPVLKDMLKDNQHAKVLEMKGLNHLFQKAETGMLDEYGKIEETLNPELLNLVSGWVNDMVKRDAKP